MRIELDGDERVVVRTRPHPRGLRGAGAGLVTVLVLYGFVSGLLSRVPALGDGWTRAEPTLTAIAAVLAAIAGLAWVILPLWRWLRTRIVITTRRVLVLRGSRTRRELPLGQIIAVNARPGLGRGPVPGTLVLSTPRGEARVAHVPDVHRAAQLVRQLRQYLPWSPAPAAFPVAGMTPHVTPGGGYHG